MRSAYLPCRSHAVNEQSSTNWATGPDQTKYEQRVSAHQAAERLPDSLSPAPSDKRHTVKESEVIRPSRFLKEARNLDVYEKPQFLNVA